MGLVLVIEKVFTELDKREKKVWVKGVLLCNGRIESLDINITDKYYFKFTGNEFIRIFKEMNRKYYINHRKTSIKGIPISITERLEPRMISWESLRNKNPDNGDHINSLIGGLAYVFQDSECLGIGYRDDIHEQLKIL